MICLVRVFTEQFVRVRLVIDNALRRIIEIMITLLAIKSHNASLIYCRLEPKPDCAIPAVENIPLRSDGKWLSADTLRHNSGRAEK